MDPGFRARLRAGDEGAFGTLFHDHATSVYNHCFRLTGDWSAAEDCTSLVFLEAWRLRSKIQPEGGGLLPWLLGIATNVVHRRRRVARRHRALLDRLPAPGLLPDFADELVGRMEDQQKIEAMRQALDWLPRTDREVLALCVWAGLDYAAAAQALGIAVGTVRSRLSRARRRLDELTEKDLRANKEPAPVTWQLTGDRNTAVRPDEGKSR
ncbi:RNA polymerase sigma factor [Streptomyces sp. SKN60]|nr:RNA polymerase sigma factor [Streptomyces sp. SKN60]